jgi:peroxiredoxin
MGSDAALAEGESVPATSAPLVHPDGDAVETSLSDLYEDQPILVVFYTNDFSPDCVTEWCSFRDYAWFTSNDQVRVVGSSKSRKANHRRFISYLDLDFPLFSDRDLEVSDAFGVTYRTFKVFPR